MNISLKSFKLLLPIISILLIAGIACSDAAAEAREAGNKRIADAEARAAAAEAKVADAEARATAAEAKGATANPGKLVVYSGRKESLVAPIIEQFASATGIDVQVKYGKTGAIAATILEEGKNSPADVFFAQDPGGLGAIAKAGMFQKIDTDTLNKVPTWAKSKEAQWVGLSGRARTVVYSTKNNISPEDLPASLEGFTDPKWKGRIGWPPTNGSFQAMVTAMRVQGGEEKTRNWLKGIKSKQQKVYPKNTPIVAAAGAGEIDVGFVNHYYLHRFIAEEGEGFGARNHHLNSGDVGSLILVAGAGILDTSKNTGNAKKFLNFMLSPVAQQYFTGQTYEYPLVEGVKANPLLNPIDKINKPSIDMASLDDLAGTQKLLKEVGLLN